jgi:hypothetical protein
MMKPSTKIIITLAALILGAVQSYARETCAFDGNKVLRGYLDGR